MNTKIVTAPILTKPRIIPGSQNMDENIAQKQGKLTTNVPRPDQKSFFSNQRSRRDRPLHSSFAPALPYLMPSATRHHLQSEKLIKSKVEQEESAPHLQQNSVNQAVIEMADSDAGKSLQGRFRCLQVAKVVSKFPHGAVRAKFDLFECETANKATLIQWMSKNSVSLKQLSLKLCLLTAEIDKEQKRLMDAIARARSLEKFTLNLTLLIKSVTRNNMRINPVLSGMIQQLSARLGDLKTLKQFDLISDGDNVSGALFGRMLSAIAKLTQLETLNISSLPYNMRQADLDLFTTGLKRLFHSDSLQRLDIKFNYASYTDDAVSNTFDVLTEQLATNKTIKHVAFTLHVSSPAFKCFTALARNKTIETVSITVKNGVDIDEMRDLILHSGVFYSCNRLNIKFSQMGAAIGYITQIKALQTTLNEIKPGVEKITYNDFY